MIYNLTNINGLFRDDVKEILQSLGITNAKILMLQQEQIGSEFDRICQWNRYLEGLSEDTVVLTTAYICILKVSGDYLEIVMKLTIER